MNLKLINHNFLINPIFLSLLSIYNLDKLKSKSLILKIKIYVYLINRNMKYLLKL